jgi:hypothetical protein
MDNNGQYENKNLFGIIILSGLLVGTLDISAAFIDVYIATGRGPEAVCKYIASGVFGNDAFTGGSGMIVWGLIFHFIIAFSFTIFFFFLYRNMKFIRRYPLPSAILYGIFMWAITNRVVVPLSNTPPGGPFNIWKALKAMTILTVLISLPLTIIARKFLKPAVPYRSHQMIN